MNLADRIVARLPKWLLRYLVELAYLRFGVVMPTTEEKP